MSVRRSILMILVLACLPVSLPAQPPAPPVYTVLFTHIEDNTPGGTLGTQQSRQNYLLYRGRLIAMANLARDYDVPWSLQPDWKFLRAALLYEDSTLTPTTNNKNFLRYLKEDLGVIIDPHSHESQGYNYTDVAHLLDSLGVGTTTVIGGHVWDPDLPEFQEWDRYRVPVAGGRYPWALWRGDILMGSGTPNHVNDPVVSGVWRPRDRYNYFDHDSTANIVAIGQYKGTVACLTELHELYQTGTVPAHYMLTNSHPIRPSILIAPGGLEAIEDTLIAPIAALRDSGIVVPTNFTSLVQAWQTRYGSRGFLYDAEAVSGVGAGGPGPGKNLSLSRCFPNPFRSTTAVEYSVSQETRVRIVIFDLLGRQVAVLADEPKAPGRHVVTWDAREMAGGMYFIRLQEGSTGKAGAAAGTKLIVLR